MLRSIIICLFLVPFLAKAQTDLLILKKGGGQVQTYTTGSELMMETVYHQWFHGIITEMRHDSVFLNGLPFHYKEIATIKRAHVNFANTVLAAGMMVTGGGIVVLGAVNGAYRGDKSKDWYTHSGIITSGALLVGGFLLTKTRSRKYAIGRKFTLDYLTLNPAKTGHS